MHCFHSICKRAHVQSFTNALHTSRIMKFTIWLCILLISTGGAGATCTADVIINATGPAFLRTRVAIMNLSANVQVLTPAALRHLRNQSLRILRRTRRKTNNVIMNLCWGSGKFDSAWSGLEIPDLAKK